MVLAPHLPSINKLCFSLGTLKTGIYTLILDEIMNSFAGAAHDVTINVAPLSAAAWLIGIAAIGLQPSVRAVRCRRLKSD